jgi:formylmethanofuran dehydrogenase subunit E
MSCRLSQETIANVISFHGHSCPGFKIGMRVSELARRELGNLPDTRLVCITETDMCAAICFQNNTFTPLQSSVLNRFQHYPG